VKDPRIEGLAKVIVNYSLELEAGQTFFISSGAIAEPLVQALYEETLRAGANPVLDLSLEGTQPAFFELASDAQIDWISPTQQWAFNEADARMRVLADTNVRELSGVPPEKQTRRQTAMHPYMQKMMERSAAGDLRWNVTLFPTNAYAAEAGMSLREYEHSY
jgi:aminopeptidase